MKEFKVTLAILSTIIFASFLFGFLGAASKRPAYNSYETCFVENASNREKDITPFITQGCALITRPQDTMAPSRGACILDAARGENNKSVLLYKAVECSKRYSKNG